MFTLDMGGPDSYNGSSKRRRWYDSDSYYGGGYGYGSGGYVGQPLTLPAVRLRGLPYNCTESDVQEFFAGLNIVDVLMVHKQGRFSGEAYVVFGMHMQVDYALQRNRQNMGRRYVEVFRCNRKEYYNAIVAELNDTKHDDDESDARVKLASVTTLQDREDEEHTGVLRLRGLPFSVSKQDIVEFFSEFGVTEDNIHILTLPEGRATGEAFVEFEGPAESKAAMKKDKMMIGSRYVELFVSSREEATKAAARYK